LFLRRRVAAMKQLLDMIRSEDGHAYTGYGIGSAVVIVLVVLLLLMLL
jgi:hypothetical protein